MNVTLEFRKRGLPESNPPQVDQDDRAGSDPLLADVLRELFNRENVAGFVSLTVEQGDAEPVITSYNTTSRRTASSSARPSPALDEHTGERRRLRTPASPVQNLVGLISDSDRLAYFGDQQPERGARPPTSCASSTRPAALIGESSRTCTVSPFGQRQFQSAEIQSTFGISEPGRLPGRGRDDSRAAARSFPYASNLRLASQDPSFIEAGLVEELEGLPARRAERAGTQQQPLAERPAALQHRHPGVHGGRHVHQHRRHRRAHRRSRDPAAGETRRLENVVDGQWRRQRHRRADRQQGARRTASSRSSRGRATTTPTPRSASASRWPRSPTPARRDAGQSQYMVRPAAGRHPPHDPLAVQPGHQAAQYDLVYRASTAR